MARPRLITPAPLPLGLVSPDRSRPAPEQLYTALRRAILRLELPPGAAVAEPLIAARTGVSRTPVREALHRLRDDGLVEVLPNLGSFVARISVAQLQEAVALRGLLESEAAGRVAARGPGRQQALRQGRAAQSEAQALGDLDRLYRLDEAFHATLFDSAGLPLMEAACRTARAHMERVHHAAIGAPDRARQALAAHAVILARIEEGDAPGARAAMAAHVVANATDLAALAQSHPDWVRA